MKKFLLSLFALCTANFALADVVNVEWSASTDWTLDGATATYSANGISLEAVKNDGATNPTVNANANDLRVYAKGSLTISATGEMNEITFTISTQGKKRLTDITPSTGEIAYAEDYSTVTWTGKASEVTFTVGEKAVYGTDGESKAGQFDVNSPIVVNVKSAEIPQTVAVESVDITYSSEVVNSQYITLVQGETAQLKAVVNPSNATNKNVSWEAIQDDEVIALENGKVTALNPGKAAAVVTTEEGEFQAYVYIIVTEPQPSTIADFIANEGGTCYLTGVVSNIKNTTYGNFDLTDETGTIYVYGCLTPEGETKQFESLGIVEGDYITVLASTYSVYKDTKEAVNVVFVEKTEAPKTVTFEFADNDAYVVVTPSDDEATYAVAVYNQEFLDMYAEIGMPFESPEELFDFFAENNMVEVTTGQSTFDVLDFMEYLGAEELHGEYTIVVAECHKEGQRNVVRDGAVTTYTYNYDVATGLKNIATSSNTQAYDLTGRKVNLKNAHGIVIVNGKKVVK